MINIRCQFQGLEEVIAVAAAVSEQEGRARKRRKMLPLPPFVLFVVAAKVGVNYPSCGGSIDRALNYS